MTFFSNYSLHADTSDAVYCSKTDKFEAPGINFKAKLIGIVDVPDAKGQDMCLENMAKLKVIVFLNQFSFALFRVGTKNIHMGTKLHHQFFSSIPIFPSFVFSHADLKIFNRTLSKETM